MLTLKILSEHPQNFQSCCVLEPKFFNEIITNIVFFNEPVNDKHRVLLFGCFNYILVETSALYTTDPHAFSIKKAIPFWIWKDSIDQLTWIRELYEHDLIKCNSTMSFKDWYSINEKFLKSELTKKIFKPSGDYNYGKPWFGFSSFYNMWSEKKEKVGGFILSPIKFIARIWRDYF